MTFADIGAAVIGTGFIGTVHVEALRRIGVAGPRRARQHAGTRCRTGARARRRAAPTPSLDDLLADPGGRRRPRHLAERPPRAAGEGDPRRRQARRLREAAGDDRGRVGASSSSWRRPAGLRQRGQLQHPLLPAQPARPRAWSRAGDLGDVRLVTGRYFQDWLLHDTDWNWRLEPDKGGALRAVGDIGSHWLDLTTFMTGQRVVVGDGRPGDVRRHAPRAARGRSRRSRPSAPPTPSRRDDGHRGRRDDPAPLRQRRPRRRWPSRQISAGRKNSLQWEIDGSERRRRLGLRERRTSCGSATATGRTRSCSATRR